MCVNGVEDPRIAWERSRVAWHQPGNAGKQSCAKAKIVDTDALTVPMGLQQLPL